MSMTINKTTSGAIPGCQITIVIILTPNMLTALLTWINVAIKTLTAELTNTAFTPMLTAVGTLPALAKINPFMRITTI